MALYAECEQEQCRCLQGKVSEHGNVLEPRPILR